jgi:transcription initiation factor TFIIIB Brf1 subunit/transcription initiation factor TFIIB
MVILTIDAEKCPECGSKRIVLGKHGEVYCESCGFVLQSEVLVIEAKKGRVEGVYYNPRNKKIGVIINGILASSMEKKMRPFYAELKKMSLPKHVEAEVIRYCKLSVERKLTMSYSKVELLAGLIYLTGRRYGVPILISELTKTFQITKKELLRAAKFAAKKLNLSFKPLQDIESLIIRICADLGHEELAYNSIKTANKLKIDNQTVLAGIAIWKTALNARVKIQKRRLARVTGISETVLRKFANS